MRTNLDCMLGIYNRDFEFLDLYCNIIKKTIDNEKTTVKLLYDKAINAQTEEGRGESADISDEERYYVDDIFPSIQWSSMFVTAFNLFEKTLNDACIMSGGISSSNIKLDDIVGKGIERAKIYLSKVQNIKSPFREKEWNQAKNYSKIRNVLSHTYGELDLNNDEHKKIFKIAKVCLGLKVIKINHDSHIGQAGPVDFRNFHSAGIIIEEQLVLNSISIYKTIIDQVYKELSKK